jgi:N-acetyl-gamma-glutamylphosphate reductase
LDNLGKGASSAAVQNIEIMLGVQRLAKDSEIHNFGRQNA